MAALQQECWWVRGFLISRDNDTKVTATYKSNVSILLFFSVRPISIRKYPSFTTLGLRPVFILYSPSFSRSASLLSSYHISSAYLYDSLPLTFIFHSSIVSLYRFHGLLQLFAAVSFLISYACLPLALNSFGQPFKAHQ